MKKNIFALCTAFFTIAFFIGCTFVITPTKKDQLNVKYIDENVLITQNALNDNRDSKVFAIYSDTAENFSQLYSNADYVVRATVNSTSDNSSVTQTSSLTINEIYKGEIPNNIILYQIANDNNVDEGIEYILFLNKQCKSTTEENVFYPLGGGQGVMRIDHEQKMVYTNSKKMLSTELNEWINQNINPTSYNIKSTTETYQCAVES